MSSKKFLAVEKNVSITVFHQLENTLKLIEIKHVRINNTIFN